MIESLVSTAEAVNLQPQLIEASADRQSAACNRRAAGVSVAGAV